MDLGDCCDGTQWEGAADECACYEVLYAEVCTYNRSWIRVYITLGTYAGK